MSTPLIVLAQEATPLPEPTPIVEETATPTASVEPTPTEVATSTPEATLEASPTATPIEEPTQTPQPEVQSATNENSLNLAPPSETPTVTSTPEVTIVTPENEGVITTEIVENQNPFPVTVQNNSWFSLTTDKLDYAPTETAIITGSDFTANKTYQITVSSTDDPATSRTSDITTDLDGKFIFYYQLDGIYRPNYKVEIKDGGFVVATTTFTDSDPQDVSTLDELNTALADVSITTINIIADIAGIPATLVVPAGHPVTINGGSHTLTFTGLEAPALGDVDDRLLIQAPATINNLIVNAGLVTPTAWAGTYTIHVYNTSATLNGVTATNGNGGILINGSTVTLTGAINVSSNGFGGIEVSKGTAVGLSNSALTVTGTLVNGTESYGKPTIWLVNGQGTVTGANVPSTTIQVTKPDATTQTQYYLTAGNAVNPIVCTNDAQGANDEPNQKDLTKMCVNTTNLPTSIATEWNWDDTSWTGNNTGDACSLFDTDNDNLANYALCVRVGGVPTASYLSKLLYTCNDSSAERCFGSALVSPSAGTTCSASVVAGSNPFDAGSDTVASCTIALADVAGAKLIDVCSYPSNQPNSDPSDCIISTSTNNNTGTITIVKVGNGVNTQDFGFDTTGGLTPNELLSSPDFSLDHDSDGTLSNTKTFTGVSAGTYTVGEVV